MSHIAKANWLWAILLVLAGSACGKGPAVSPEVFYTQAAETVVVQLTATALSIPPTQSATATSLGGEVPQGTNTPLLTPTPLTGVPSSTPLSFATLPSAQTACDNFQFVADVTYPDGMEVPAGSSFVKTWRVTNLGPCTWNKNYHLVFVGEGSGTNWGSHAPVALPGVIAPGENLEISITLTAPTKPGTYEALFRLANANGYYMAPLTTYLSVEITVK